MTSFALTDVHAVLPDRVVEWATIVVEEGVIAEVRAAGVVPRGAIDGRGAFCLPGLVDSHSDGLEKEQRPRANVELPLDFAVRSFEGRVRAAGVTTMFHGVAFEHQSDGARTVDGAHAACVAIEARQRSGTALIDHRILHRLDARDPDGFDALVERLAGGDGDETPPPVVSFEDHTPGQGQYTDRAQYEHYVARSRGVSPDHARSLVDDVIAAREERRHHRDSALPWLTERARRRAITLLAHDPVTEADVDAAASWSAHVAEFPTTIEAAGRAKALGLHVVAGAPNVVRGGSHNGNASAQQLISLGLCDSLASDYLPATLLGAVARLVDHHTCTLPRAVGLVTAGPATAVGFTDRGRLEPGQRGDLVLASFDGALPTVRAVYRPEDSLDHTRLPEVTLT